MLAAGAPDPSFGDGGIVISPVPTLISAVGATVQSDGKILLAGDANVDSHRDFALARLNADGTVDTTFDGDGVITTRIGSFARAQAAVVQGDGKILIVGTTVIPGQAVDAPGQCSVALVRYNPGGSLDASFGDHGIVTTAPGFFQEIAGVALQSDGKTLIAGTWNPKMLCCDNGTMAITSQYVSDFVLLRFNADGSADTTFDHDGMVITDFGEKHGAYAKDIVVQPDGKIWVTGSVVMEPPEYILNVWEPHPAPSIPLILARYNSVGSLDTTFGDDGFLFCGSNALAVQTDGRVLADWARYNVNGSRDETFLPRGSAVGEMQCVHDIAVMDDGRILVTGSSWNVGDDRTNDLMLVRLNADGASDTSFDGAGLVTTDIGPVSLYESQVVAQSDGRILVLGRYWDGYQNVTFVARYLGDNRVEELALSRRNVAENQPAGALVGILSTPDRDTGESLTYALVSGEGSDDNASFTIDESRLKTAAPFDHESKGSYSIRVRSTDAEGLWAEQCFTIHVADVNEFAGALDPAFGDGGKVITDIESPFGYGAAVAVQSDGKIVTVGPSYSGNTKEDFAIARYNPDGTLDPAFGHNGRVTTAIGPDVDNATHVAVQNDGKILVAGYSRRSGSRTAIALARYNPDGTLDPSFGADGIVITDVGEGECYATDVILQDDGKILVSECDGFAVLRYNPDGSLDTSFGGDGHVVTLVGANGGAARGMALQKNGKIVLAGYSSDGNYRQFTLVRYNPDGSLDASFDNDGIVIQSHGPSGGGAETVAIQDDGKLVAAGAATVCINGNDVGFLAARYNPDGSLDASFGEDGIVITVLAQSSFLSWANPEAVNVQPDGRIVVAGYCSVAGGAGFALVRYNANGSLDATFDGDGKVLASFGFRDARALDMAVQSNGNILVAGYHHGSATCGSILVRYLGDNRAPEAIDLSGATVAENQPAGAIVGSLWTSDPDAGDSFAYALVPGEGSDDNESFTIESDQIKTATTFDYETKNSYSIRVRSTDARGLWVEQVFTVSVSDVQEPLTAGSLDPTFGDGGIVTTPVSEGTFIAAMGMQSDGKIVVAGSTSSYGRNDFSLLRYNTDGELDATFGCGGMVTTAIGSGRGMAVGMVLQSDGKIVVAGWSEGLGLHRIDFTLARYNADGSLDVTFGDGGIVFTDLGGWDDLARSVALQSDGKILVAGYSYGTSNVVLARYDTNGSLDAAFGTDGIAILDVGSLFSISSGMVLQSDGKILLTGEFTRPRGPGWVGVPEGTLEFALVRCNADGTLDTTFDGDGTVTTDIGPRGASVGSIAVQSDGKILATGSCDGGFTLVRYNTDGSLDSGFDGDGIVTTPIGAGWSGCSVAVQSDGRILVAGYSHDSPAPASDFAIVRYNPDGSLDSTFDGDGKVTTDVGSSYDSRRGIVVQDDGRIVVAGDSRVGPRRVVVVVRYLGDNQTREKIELSARTVAENQPTGTLVGILSRSDADAGGTFMYSLVSGEGSDDNAAFMTDGNRLKTAASFDYEAKRSYSVRVRSTDGDGHWVEQVFRVLVSDAQEPLTAGSLDPTFGNGGTVITDLGSTAEYGTAVAVQPDGKIVMVGASFNKDTMGDFVLLRYNPDGTLDTSFDGDGKVTTVIGPRTGVARGVAVLSDGKILVGGLSSQPLNRTALALARYNVDGTLDPSFGTDGIAMTDLGWGPRYEMDMVLQDDGKILVAGDGGFSLMRFNPDGSLDRSFGSNGQAVTRVGWHRSSAHSVAVQEDGKIVLAGLSFDGTDNQFTLVRYNADGSLDAGFDGDGILITIVGPQDGFAESVAIQGDGKIVVAGWNYEETAGRRLVLVRYEADGRLDTSFDDDGIATVIDESANISTGTAVSVQADGRILVAAGGFALVRFNANGTLDLTFDGDGKAVTNLGSGERAHDMVVQSDGNILLAGSSSEVWNMNFALVRYLGDNEVPERIELSATTVAENQPAGTVVGSLSTSDPDAGETFTYSLVSGEGSDDNAWFRIDGDQIVTAASLDFETKESYSIRVRSTDAGGLWVEAVFTIHATDVNDAPVARDDLYRAREGRPLRVAPPSDGVLANDSDQDGVRLAATLVSGPSHGRLKFKADGSFTYTPDRGFFGADSFTYKAGDGQLDSAPCTVTIQVEGSTPRVHSVVVNGGAAQRSMVTSLKVTFDRTVTIDPGAFLVSRLGDGLPVGLNVVVRVQGGRTVARLTFTGPDLVGGSLADGNYQLTILADKVHRGATSLDGDRNGSPGGDFTFGERAKDAFFRLLGDSDGDRDVDPLDRQRFRLSYYYGLPRYRSRFDCDGDGDLDTADLLAFRLNYGTKLPKP